jgi:hypothetical protein
MGGCAGHVGATRRACAPAAKVGFEPIAEKPILRCTRAQRNACFGATSIHPASQPWLLSFGRHAANFPEAMAAQRTKLTMAANAPLASTGQKRDTRRHTAMLHWRPAIHPVVESTKFEVGLAHRNLVFSTCALIRRAYSIEAPVLILDLP